MEEQYAKVHSVGLTPGGMLERITGKREIRVNSIHAQAIDRLADGLTAEAMAPDGLIEAVSVTGAPAFALAVQWHPEELTATPEDWDRRVFHEFANAVRAAGRD